MQHIVMFKFRDDVPQAVRSQAATLFKHDIEALPSVIPTIRHIHVGVNINPAEQWDI